MRLNSGTMQMLPLFTLICVLLAFTAAETAQPDNVLPNTKICGSNIGNKRLIGGQHAYLGEFPWMVALIYSNDLNDSTHQCTGVLINSRYVLTAAHCLGQSSNVKSARLGEWNTDTSPDCEDVKLCAPPHIDVPIETIIVHEQYTHANSDHDIALLRLKDAVTYTDYIKPICLPLTPEIRSKNLTDVIAETAGWINNKREDRSNLLLKAPIQMWDLKKCQLEYSAIFQISDKQLCGLNAQEKDGCDGDPGSPLMLSERIDDRDVYFAIGILSAGRTPCTIPNFPNIFTRVDAYTDWIQKQITNSK